MKRIITLIVSLLLINHSFAKNTGISIDTYPSDSIDVLSSLDTKLLSTNTKKFKKDMIKLNLFIGTNITNFGIASFTNNINYTVGKQRWTQLDIYDVVGRQDLHLGIGAFMENKVLTKQKYNVSFRYGVSYDLIRSRFKIDKLSYATSEGESNVSQNSTAILPYWGHMLGVQVLPTIDFMNKYKQKTISIGIGAKFGLNLRPLLQDGYQLFKSNEIPKVVFSERRTQGSFVINLGYKSINLFAQVSPFQVQVAEPNTVKYSQIDFNFSSDITKNSLFSFRGRPLQKELAYTIGIRIGK